MIRLARLESAIGPASWLVGCRSIGLFAAFAASLVIVRVLPPADVGTYRQLFLIYATLFGLAQLGMAESLYYFVPRDADRAGRRVSNALVILLLSAVSCVAALIVFDHRIAGWMTNPALEAPLTPLAIFLALMLVTAPFEIVLVARKATRTAALVYGATDVVRALAILGAAATTGSVGVVLWAVVLVGAVRTGAMLWWFGREVWTVPSRNAGLWREQWAYTAPFALAAGLETVQGTAHQYVVAAQVDPALFAVYAVGCMQVPLVDIVTTSSANVMMVAMSERGFDRSGPAALALWHHTIVRLAIVILPLAAFLVAMAGPLIEVLFTPTYAASGPIFAWWALTIVFTVPCVDAMLRVHAQTPYLVRLNAMRLVTVLTLTAWLLTTIGLAGAVIAVLASTALVRLVALGRLAHLMHVGFGRVLPWAQLATIAACAVCAVAPTVWFVSVVTLPGPFALAGAAGIYGTTYAALALGLASRFPASQTPGDGSPDRPTPLEEPHVHRLGAPIHDASGRRRIASIVGETAEAEAPVPDAAR